MSGDVFLIPFLITLLLLGIAIVVTIFLAYKYEQVRRKFERWRERELATIRQAILETARRQFEQWRERELATIKQESLEIARREAQVELEQWKKQYEQSIRQDAIQRSQSVTIGKITEHFTPYLPGFSHNPKDARFIGSPVDFVVFDGLNEGEIRKIIFVEVKTGNSTLTSRERWIRDAIRSGKVEWIELRLSLLSGPSLESGKSDG